MRAWWLGFVVFTACGFPTAILRQADGGSDDGGTADALFCYGSIVKVCLFAPPTTPVMLTDNTDIDTGTASPSAMCDQNNDKMADYCVVAGRTFSLAANKVLTAHGSRPLVILAAGTADVSGDIDVSSHRTGPQPIGAGAVSATATMCAGVGAPTGTSGAAGGSFSGKGATGADGNPDDGNGGTAPAVATLPTTLGGGCPGSDAPVGGAGGAGGGAIAIVAAQIQITARINASGAGGQGGQAVKSGGGGGGAGGMIVLDSPASITISGKVALTANGGGGGQGGALAQGGTPGSESAGVGKRANGGTSSNLGGSGGDGSSGTTRDAPVPLEDAAGGGGGGGGGGGAGFIHAPGVDPSKVDPPSS